MMVGMPKINSHTYNPTHRINDGWNAKIHKREDHEKFAKFTNEEDHEDPKHIHIYKRVAFSMGKGKSFPPWESYL